MACRSSASRLCELAATKGVRIDSIFASLALIYLKPLVCNTLLIWANSGIAERPVVEQTPELEEGGGVAACTAGKSLAASWPAPSPSCGHGCHMNFRGPGLA